MTEEVEGKQMGPIDFDRFFLSFSCDPMTLVFFFLPPHPLHFLTWLIAPVDAVAVVVVDPRAREEFSGAVEAAEEEVSRRR